MHTHPGLPLSFFEGLSIVIFDIITGDVINRQKDWVILIYCRIFSD